MKYGDKKQRREMGTRNDSEKWQRKMAKKIGGDKLRQETDTENGDEMRSLVMAARNGDHK